MPRSTRAQARAPGAGAGHLGILEGDLHVPYRNLLLQRGVLAASPPSVHRGNCLGTCPPKAAQREGEQRPQAEAIPGGDHPVVVEEGGLTLGVKLALSGSSTALRLLCARAAGWSHPSEGGASVLPNGRQQLSECQCRCQLSPEYLKKVSPS